MGPQRDVDRRAAFRPLSQDAAAEPPQACTVEVDGAPVRTLVGRPLIEALSPEEQPGRFPHACYHPSLGPIQTCDTCLVEVDGRLVRACATQAVEGQQVTLTGAAASAREEAAQRLVRKHVLYCTVCDHNDGACPLKKSIEASGLTKERIGHRVKPYEIDDSHVFYRYDPDQCILCGRCVEACQDVQVTETLSIDWGSDEPRVLWDGGKPAGESSCVSCGHCVTVCPCNALLEKTMVGRAGLFTDWPQDVWQEAIDLVVVAELFFSRTCEYADVVLPAAASLEKDGTFTSTERRIQRLHEVMPPVGDSRPDWRILQGIAAHLGVEWGYTHPSQVMDEVARLTPLFAGVRYDRLEGYDSLQWPVAADGTDSPLLYTDGFAFDDGKARLHPLEFREPRSQPDEDYPLHVNNGRVLEHFHEGNLTLRSAGLSRISPDTYAEMTRVDRSGVRRRPAARHR